ncbi:MAG: copper homeostasis membrane protein CopD [Alphaproteobacteria bacterium]|nr:copper homeostasis membrane protein CopD [Alphaproteobacteria bacterium]
MDAFIVAIRTLHFAACASLAGVGAFECLIADPALDGSATAADLSRRLNSLAWISLALAVISGLGWLAGVAADMSGQSLGGVFGSGAVGTALMHTRIGEDWRLRSALVVLLALCLAWNRRRGRFAGDVAWIGLALSVLLLASLAWAGHGAADEGTDGTIHLVADLLHLLAAGAWLGGLAPLALLLTAARRDSASGMTAAAATTRRFSLLAVVSVGVLLASGIVNTWYLAGNVPALIGTLYGRLLLLKIALFLAMLTIAAVNRLRLTPRFDGTDAHAALARLRRNALIESGLGLGILAIVGVLGVLPPGLHTEPIWPLPFRLVVSALSTGALVMLLIFAIGFCVCGAVAVAAFAAGWKRPLGAAFIGLIVCVAFGGAPAMPALVAAYPTTFFAPSAPYNASAVDRGAVIYAQNCAACHGADGRGDGPAAAGLPTKPANLVQPHLFAHTPGDLFWWVSHGYGSVMPGFDGVLTPTDRWSVIHFIRARAAGVIASGMGPAVSTIAAAQVPDFAFESGGVQDTLSQVLAEGPALLVLFGADAPIARLQQLGAAQLKLIAAGLPVVAIGVNGASQGAVTNPPYVVGLSAKVAAMLSLFRNDSDGGETELMLDRNGNVRVRWTASGGGLATPETLAADALTVARFSGAAPNHAGHGG